MPNANGKDKGKVNKSDLIREALAANPDSNAKEIVKLLGDRGIKVAPTLVYYIRSKAQQAGRKAKRARVVAQSEKTAERNPVEMVMRVKELARGLGGIKNLKMLVDLLAE